MKCLLSALMLISVSGLAQVKKTIDHSVYDNWRSLGERSISATGKYMLYAINPQEGDGELVLRSTDGTKELHIPRGTEATFSADGRYAVCRIKAPFADTRQARIKKKKPEDMPKDSLGIVTLENMNLVKIS